jgi:UDP:flavonoid glycosyltransferase YjiC (YdhE family)
VVRRLGEAACSPRHCSTQRHQSADQFFNAEILTAAGVARALPNDAQRPGAIAGAVEALLGDAPERQAAARLQNEIAAMPSPAEVVPGLVKVAGA